MRLPRRVIALALSLGFLSLGLLVASLARAERPSAPRLLPKETLVFARIPDLPTLIEKFNETSTGRIARDEKIKPLLTHLYGSAVTAFEQLQEQVGVSLSDALDIPKGEICFAIVDPKDNGPPAAVIMLDVGDDNETVKTLTEKAETALAGSGAKRTTETVGDTELVIYEDIGEDNSGAIYFVRDGTIVVCTSRTVTDGILEAWDGTNKARKSLLSNRKFVTIMRRCSGTKEERPHFTFYADPIELATVALRDDFGAQTALAFLPALGLDGLEGIGAGLIFAPEEFDSIGHFHILLDNPRTGILQMIALKPGDFSPEPWVPRDVASYTSIDWDVRKTFDLICDMITEFNGEGVFDDQVERRINTPLGINLEEDVIDVIDGRVTLVSAIESPARLNSGTSLIGIKLKDADHFGKKLAEMVEKFEDRLTKKSQGTVKYYVVGGGEGDQPSSLPFNLRRPEPCFALVDDYLLFSDSTTMLQNALTAKGSPEKGLAGDLEFKLVANKIRRHTRDSKPSMLSFSRPEEGMKLLYDLAQSEETRALLQSGAEGNPALKALSDALTDNPLPEFEELSKYLAPTGSMMTSDETGLHITSFGLRRE